MKLLKWIRVKLGLDYYTEIVDLKLPHGGFPPDNMVWKDSFPLADMECAFNKPGVMTVKIAPLSCPDCGSDTVQKGHDWWDIEGGGQFMVWTTHCPNGHGYCVEVA